MDEPMQLCFLGLLGVLASDDTGGDVVCAEAQIQRLRDAGGVAEHQHLGGWQIPHQSRQLVIDGLPKLIVGVDQVEPALGVSCFDL